MIEDLIREILDPHVDVAGMWWSCDIHYSVIGWLRKTLAHVRDLWYKNEASSEFPSRRAKR